MDMRAVPVIGDLLAQPAGTAWRPAVGKLV